MRLGGGGGKPHAPWGHRSASATPLQSAYTERSRETWRGGVKVKQQGSSKVSKWNVTHPLSVQMAELFPEIPCL